MVPSGADGGLRGSLAQLGGVQHDEGHATPARPLQAQMSCATFCGISSICVL
jgi:hypothetical protein